MEQDLGAQEVHVGGGLQRGGLVEQPGGHGRIAARDGRAGGADEFSGGKCGIAPAACVPRHRERIGTAASGQHVGSAAVQERAPGRAGTGRGGLTNQLVGEAEPVAAVDEQAQPHPDVQVVEYGDCRRLQDVGQQLQVHLGPQGGRRTDRAAGRPQRGQHGLEGIPHGVRQQAVVVALGERQQQQRIAAGTLPQLLRALVADQRPDRGERKGPEVEVHGAVRQGQRGRSGGDDGQQALAPACGETQPLQRAGPRQLQVVDRDDQGPGPRRTSRHPQQGGEQPRLLLPGVGGDGQRGRPGDVDMTEQRCDCGGVGTQDGGSAVGVESAQQHLQSVEQRLQRQVPAEGVTAPVQHAGRCPGSGCECVEHRGLADARLTANDDDPGGARARLAELGGEAGQLGCAAHRRRAGRGEGPRHRLPAQQLGVQLGGLGGGVGAEILGEPRSEPRERIERRRRACRPTPARA